MKSGGGIHPLDQARRDALRAEYEGRVNRVVDHIHAHLSEPLALEDLARIAAFSPFHFHRVFSALAGESLAVYIKRLRIERAASALLQNPAASITQVALDCGFTSSASFARAFRARFGMSAGAWRAESKNRQTMSKPGQGERKDGKEPRSVIVHPSRTGRRGGRRPHRRRNEMKIEVKELPCRRVAYVRRMGPYDQSAKEAWDSLCRWAGPRGLLGPQAVFIGIGHDDPEITDPAKCRYDACVEVGPETRPERHVGIAELAGGKHVVARYEGPGEGIKGAYARIFGSWLPESGFQPADGPSYEVYLKEPSDGIFAMDICVPVKPL
jgi:AraC family transcriptional regulator